MNGSAFISADIERLDLGNGHWVEVRTEIGVKAQKKIDSALLGGVRGVQELIGRNDVTAAEVEMRLDGAEAFMIKLHTYIYDWSFRDAAGKPVQVTKDAIDSLKPAVADEILAALNRFLDAQEAERASDPFGKQSVSK